MEVRSVPRRGFRQRWLWPKHHSHQTKATAFRATVKSLKKRGFGLVFVDDEGTNRHLSGVLGDVYIMCLETGGDCTHATLCIAEHGKQAVYFDPLANGEAWMRKCAAHVPVIRDAEFVQGNQEHDATCLYHVLAMCTTFQAPCDDDAAAHSLSRLQ